MDTSSSVGIYSNLEIEDAIESGHIICTPFDNSNVNQASLDVTLGYHFYRLKPRLGGAVYNSFDETQVKEHFDGPYKALPHKVWCDKFGLSRFKNIPDDHPIIVLGPGERVLVNTHEFVGIKPPGTFQIKARSTWARNGIAVCLDAGYADPGYINRITLQVQNLNKDESIVLPVGERIAQAVFIHTGQVRGSYGVAKMDDLSHKYQSGSDIETIIKTWSPNTMLPKAYKDKRSMPTKVEGAVYE
jgi:deoxycytidine triphosphate deaminase